MAVEVIILFMTHMKDAETVWLDKVGDVMAVMMLAPSPVEK